MKIVIVGCGYVGVSLAMLLSKKNHVTCLDIDKQKIEMLNKRVSPIKDRDIVDYLKKNKLKLNATLNKTEAYSNCELVIICTPTNYDIKTGRFDTSTGEKVIREISKKNKSMPVFIK